MGRSATNVVGNSLATAVVAKWEGELKPEAQAQAEVDTDEGLPAPA
jgi:Na+/H+-dicarboxylate symporter